MRTARFFVQVEDPALHVVRGAAVRSARGVAIRGPELRQVERADRLCRQADEFRVALVAEAVAVVIALVAGEHRPGMRREVSRHVGSHTRIREIHAVVASVAHAVAV
jgi:hypothetical protein